LQPSIVVKKYISNSYVSELLERSIWNNGSSIAILQEVCQEPIKTRFSSSTCMMRVANKTSSGKQISICFHVNDCKISHESSKVIDTTIEWLQAEYKSIFEDRSGAMKVHIGKIYTNIWECLWTSQRKGNVV
jgi:hypothetical protein